MPGEGTCPRPWQRSVASWLFFLIWRGSGSVIDSLVAHFRFEDIEEGFLTYDVSRTHRCSVQEVTSTVEGYDGRAFHFEGQSIVECSSNVIASLMGDRPRTICAWAERAGEPKDGVGALFVYGNGAWGNCATFGLLTDLNKLKAQLWWCDFDVTVDDAVGYHHSCLSFDGTTTKMYFDGELVASRETALDTKVSPFQIGRWGGDESFSGSIDDVVLFSTALDVSDIKDIYEGVAGLCNSSFPNCSYASPRPVSMVSLLCLGPVELKRVSPRRLSTRSSHISRSRRSKTVF